MRQQGGIGWTLDEWLDRLVKEGEKRGGGGEEEEDKIQPKGSKTAKRRMLETLRQRKGNT